MSKHEVNIGKFTQDAELQEFYVSANILYFGNKLPMVLVGYSTEKSRKNRLGSSLKLEGAENVQYIFLNPKFKGWSNIEHPTMLHEMCHVKLNNGGSHGKKFQREIRRLRDMGAFDPYL